MKLFIFTLPCIFLGLTTVSARADFSPFASEVVDYSSDLTGSSWYNDPQDVLGKPTTTIPAMWGWPSAKVKIVEPAAGQDRITTINSDSYITVKFDHQVVDDAFNPFGIDFLVFGNAFYATGQSVNDAANMGSYMINGGLFAEPITVSVSQDGINWYTYANGPFADNYYPTQAYQWDQAMYDSTGYGWTDQEMDFTKPVDPDLQNTLFATGAISAADMIAAYNGSGGGTGFDLAESGLGWIQYIRVTGTGGEIDAFADVAPIPEPATLAILALGTLMMRKKR